MTHWLVVGSADNFELSRARNFDVAGMKARWSKAAAEVAPGDTVFFYLTGVMAIGGEALVTSTAFEDYEPIWVCSGPDEKYPWRFKTEPVKMRPADDYLPVKSFIGNYEYARKWPARSWTLAFQGNVHRLNDADYALISGRL